MTQTDSAPTAIQILAWLAAQPCPDCRHWLTKPPYNRSCDHCVCAGSGLAFEWASNECGCLTAEGREGGDHCDECGWVRDANAPSGWSYIHSVERPCTPCSGSGRVPKDVGLAELMEAKPWVVHEALAVEHAESLSENRRPDYTLAALRAVAAQVGMPCAS